MTKADPPSPRGPVPSGSPAGHLLVDGDQLGRTIARLAHEIVERHAEPGELALVGVHTRGVPLARRLATLIGQFSGATPDLGSVDIALYRDDLGAPHGQLHAPVVGETELDFPLEQRSVVLVDDVLYTGRTIRAAIDALLDYGRPRAVELAVLVDRGHRELPIRPDYVGKNLPTARDERIRVALSEIDGQDAVLLVPDSESPS